MFTNIRFFKNPTDPEGYLLFLKRIQAKAKDRLEDKCTTLDTPSFKRLLHQKKRIDNEIYRVNQIVITNSQSS